MRLKLIISMACAMMFLYACQGQPPTQIVLVVTATQMPDEEPTPTQEILTQPTRRDRGSCTICTDRDTNTNTTTTYSTITPNRYANYSSNNHTNWLSCSN